MILFSCLSYSTSTGTPTISLSFEFSSFKTSSCWCRSWAPPFLFRFKISFKCCISFWSFTTRASSAALTWLALTLVMIFLARSANFSVEMVSSEWSISGLTAAIKVVRVFPPRLSWRRRVIFESLYDMCALFLPYASAWMTLPRQLRLRLIVFSSSKCYYPMMSSLWIFSLPAKSQRLSLPLSSIPLAFGRFASIKSWKIVCEREEWMLLRVCRVMRLASPLFRRVKQSAALVTAYSLWPSTKIPACLSSRIFRGFSPFLS